jgi:dihydroorotase
MKIVIKNATIIDVENTFHQQNIDIEITEGIISNLGNNLKVQEDYQIIEKENLHISVGWIDTQVVFGEPGYEDTETIENGLKTAGKSGFTNVLLHSNTNPAIDNETIIQFIKNKSQNSATNIHVISCFTKNNDGENLSNIFELHKCGVVGFGDYKKNIQNTNLLKIGLQYVQNFDGIILNQPMNKDLKGKGFVNEGIQATKLGLKGIPAMAEEIELEQNIAVLEYTKGKMHIPIITSKKSVEIIKKAKEKGIQITCGTSINNLYFTDSVLENFDSNVKVFPPIRTQEDKNALIEGVHTGIIDVVTSDHCPVNIEDKQIEFELAKYGSIGLESIFGALNPIFTIEKTVEKLTNGYTIFNLKKPKIAIGEKANITLFNPKNKYTFQRENIFSTSKNSIFLNENLQGNAYGIIHQNKVVLS